MIADKMAAMIISPHHNIVQDSCDDVLALTAPVQTAAPKVNVEFPTEVRMELWIHYNCREGQADQG